MANSPAVEVEVCPRLLRLLNHTRIFHFLGGELLLFPLLPRQRWRSGIQILADGARVPVPMLLHRVTAVAEPRCQGFHNLLNLRLRRLDVGLLERILEDLCADQLDLLDRVILLVRLPLVDDIEQLGATNHLAKHRVLQIEVLARLQRHEELAPVGVLAIVRHADHARPLVCKARIELVLEGSPLLEATFATTASARGVATLEHEVLDQPMEYRVVIVLLLAQAQEVVRGSGHYVAVELEV
mmetsp:Transcript_58275/g.125171  ORF Transcript_58275/g.125171 Transcript_58275/m.125171 type:complete len:241 (-) Transcript_58275:1089-1811(-)